MYALFFVLAVIPIMGLHAQESKVILDNEKVRVTEFTAKPHEGVCGVGMHSHPAHLTVILQAAKVRVMLPDGKTVDREPRKDLVFWSEAGTHSVENIDTVIRHALIIDLKEPSVEHKGK
jgi:hypothetical protein